MFSIETHFPQNTSSPICGDFYIELYIAGNKQNKNQQSS